MDMKAPKGTALVLEGGGFRGIFTAGVLDVFMEAGITGFESVWGVSAGAMCASSFKSGQIGRNMRIMLAFRDDRRFMGLVSFARTGDLAGGDFLYQTVEREIDPSDDEAFVANPMRMFAVATDVVLGTAAYLPVRTLSEDIDAIRASASLPGVSRMVKIDGHRYLDGGTADSIPFEVALGMSDAASDVEGYAAAERAVVVLTRERSYVKGDLNERLAIRTHRYDAYPLYLSSLSSRRERYEQCRARLWEAEGGVDCDEGRVLVICPDAPVDVGITEHDGERLLSLYLRGRREGERRLEDVQRFLAR